MDSRLEQSIVFSFIHDRMMFSLISLITRPFYDSFIINPTFRHQYRDKANIKYHRNRDHMTLRELMCIMIINSFSEMCLKLIYKR
jgi:hypothetical protein